MKQTFREFYNQRLVEAPIGDYKTIGDWSKNSSFRDKRDRMLIQHPKAIEMTRKKFGNTEYLFNFYFVNSPAANKVTEEGMVTMDFIKQNLGDEVHDAVAKNMDNDSINIVFTNNKGSERKSMSAWIMAHRIGHVLARSNSNTDAYGYKEAHNHLLSQVATCMQFYGMEEFPERERDMFGSGYGRTGGRDPRRNQLAMLAFFHQVGGFRSAREGNIRDWFEVMNELIAQHLTTGKIKFRPAPATFGQRGPKGFNYSTDAKDEVDDILDMLARDMTYYIDNMLGSVVNRVFVM